MDISITLPSGLVVDMDGVPEGASQDQIKAEILRQGMATESDFMTKQEPVPNWKEAPETSLFSSSQPFTNQLKAAAGSLLSATPEGFANSMKNIGGEVFKGADNQMYVKFPSGTYSAGMSGGDIATNIGGAMAIGAGAAMAAPATVPAQALAAGASTLAAGLGGKALGTEETLGTILGESGLSSVFGGIGQLASHAITGGISAFRGQNPVLNRILEAKRAAREIGVKPVIGTSDVAQAENPIMAWLSGQMEELPIIGSSGRKVASSKQAAQSILKGAPDREEAIHQFAGYKSGHQATAEEYDAALATLDALTDPNIKRAKFDEIVNALGDEQQEALKKYTLTRVLGHNADAKGMIDPDKLLKTFNIAKTKDQLKLIFGGEYDTIFKPVETYLRATAKEGVDKVPYAKILQTIGTAANITFGGLPGLGYQAVGQIASKAYQGLPGQIIQGGAEIGTSKLTRAALAAAERAKQKQ